MSTLGAIGAQAGSEHTPASWHTARHGAPCLDLPSLTPRSSAPPLESGGPGPEHSQVAELLEQAAAILSGLAGVTSPDAASLRHWMELYESSYSVHRAIVALDDLQAQPEETWQRSGDSRQEPTASELEPGSARTRTEDTSGPVQAAPAARRERSAGLRAGSPDVEALPVPDPSTILPTDFTVSITFGADRSLLRVRGELDVLTAAAFGGFLEVAVARRGCLVVVDLAELAFIDASGLGQLARVLPRLRKDGGDLAIVSPSPMAYQLLDLTGFTAEVHVEQPAPQAVRAWAP